MRSQAIQSLLFLPLLLTPTAPVPEAEPGAENAAAPNLYRIWVDRKVGFIDRSGRVVIEPQFTWAYEFSEGLCQVNLPDKKEGYIDTSGKLVIEIDTHDDRPFRCGVAVVCTGKRTGILDHTGRVVDCPFDWMEEFSEGLSAVFVYEKRAHEKSGPLTWRQRKWGFADTTGKLVVPMQYTAAGSFSEGLAPIYVGGADLMCTGLSDGHWGYINRDGEIVIKPQFKVAESFSEGLALVSLDGMNYGWIDKSGTFAIKMMRLTSASSFHEGVAWIWGAKDSVPGRNDWGYVTKEGETFFHPAFHRSFGPLSEGLVVAQGTSTSDAANGKLTSRGLGYVDSRGSWVLKPQFSHAQPFRGGLAFVQTEGEMAYIDKSGRVIWSADIAPTAK